jgi:hypothetical protein
MSPFVKEEHLAIKDIDPISGLPLLKMRIIANVPADVIALTMPLVRATQTRIKEIWNGDHYTELHGIKYYLVFASGMTVSQLDAVYAKALARKGSYTIIASGDDLTWVDAQGRTYDGDHSSYDTTQGPDAANFQVKLLRRLLQGHDRLDEILHWLEWNFSSPFKKVYRSKGTQIVMSRYGRASGSADTTLGNTMINLLGMMFILSVCEGLRVFEPHLIQRVAMDYLGFDLKVVENHGHAEFLKCVWVDHAFFPMPCLVTRYGKLSRDPREILKIQDEIVAAKQMAYAMGNCMPGLPDEYPLLGPLLRKLRSFLPEGHVVHHAAREYVTHDMAQRYKITFDWNKPIDRPRLLQVFATTYGVTVPEILEAEELISSSGLNSVLTHRVFTIMGRRDYGLTE